VRRAANLTVDAASHTPIYEQLAAQVRALVASGQLPAGERLPTVRGLAELLLVNANTVARAYRELEHDGVVTTWPGVGVFIADEAAPVRLAQRRRMLATFIDGLFAEAAQLGLEAADVQELVRQRMEGVRTTRGGSG
jgi:GntR family transcriptional regulator